MKRREQIDLIAVDEATADNLILLINDKVKALDVFSIDAKLEKEYDDLGLFNGHVVGDIRFNNPADADRLKLDIEQAWSIGPLASKTSKDSQVRLHNCTHEEAEVNWRPCVVDDVAVKA